MPLYDFRCTQCGEDFELVQSIHETTSTTRCPACQSLARKVMSFPAIRRSMGDHFNAALGRPVANERDYRDGLKEAGEKASARAGREVSFSPVDMRDKAAAGVTDEGLESTRRREVAQGKRQVVKHF